MLGRLSATSLEKYQYFPVDSWAQEFPMCQERSLSHLEWVIDDLKDYRNPIIFNPAELLPLMKNHAMQIPSVCADFFMHQPLDAIILSCKCELIQIFKGMKIVGSRYLIVPLIEKYSIHFQKWQQVLKSLTLLADYAANYQINLALETDLEPKKFRNLLDSLALRNVGVNYDIGNSAALGYDRNEEFEWLMDDISVVHIKDRKVKGASVFLGTGAGDVARALEDISHYGQAKIFTLQTFRDERPPKVFDDQLTWLRQQLSSK